MENKLEKVLGNPNISINYDESKRELTLAVQPYDTSLELFDDEYEIVESLYGLKEEILEYYDVDTFTLLLCYTWLDGLRETNSELMYKGSILSNEYDSRHLK